LLTLSPSDKLAGREAEIFAERRRKLEQARQNRQRMWQQLKQNTVKDGGDVLPLIEQTTTSS
jgi:hypothetical protein